MPVVGAPLGPWLGLAVVGTAPVGRKLDPPLTLPAGSADTKVDGGDWSKTALSLGFSLDVESADGLVVGVKSLLAVGSSRAAWGPSVFVGVGVAVNRSEGAGDGVEARRNVGGTEETSTSRTSSSFGVKFRPNSQRKMARKIRTTNSSDCRTTKRRLELPV